MSSADLLLHPLRLRILQTFLGDRTLTTSDLQAELTDIPPASLYRHVAKLVDGGVLSVFSERRIRGAVERTYKLRTTEATVKPRELAGLTPDEHRGMFMAFVAGLLREFDRYLERGDVDLVRDGVSYRLTGMWLSSSEAQRLARELNDVLLPRVANTPRRGRRRWYFGSIALPAPESPPD
jgi:DNA-binding transcriptional ArsR family regulator